MRKARGKSAGLAAIASSITPVTVPGVIACDTSFAAAAPISGRAANCARAQALYEFADGNGVSGEVFVSKCKSLFSGMPA